MKDLSIAIYQMEIIVGNKQKNLLKLENAIKKNTAKIDLWVVVINSFATMIVVSLKSTQKLHQFYSKLSRPA